MMRVLLLMLMMRMWMCLCQKVDSKLVKLNQVERRKMRRQNSKPTMQHQSKHEWHHLSFRHRHVSSLSRIDIDVRHPPSLHPLQSPKPLGQDSNHHSRHWRQWMTARPCEYPDCVPW